jgi:isoquinoline 1-oxidoreductase beta subunit
MADVGEIVVELVESDAPLVGVNEIGVLPVAPALASALSTITGRRYRHLPLGGSA